MKNSNCVSQGFKDLKDVQVLLSCLQIYKHRIVLKTCECMVTSVFMVDGAVRIMTAKLARGQDIFDIVVLLQQSQVPCPFSIVVYEHTGPIMIEMQFHLRCSELFVIPFSFSSNYQITTIFRTANWNPQLKMNTTIEKEYSRYTSFWCMNQQVVW